MSDVLAQLLDPADLAVNMIGGLGVGVVLYALLAWILPPKSQKVYWVVLIASLALALFFKPIMPPGVRIVLNAFLSVVVPIFLLTGTPLARVVVCTLGTLALTAGDLVAALVWGALTGMGVVGSETLLEHLPLYLVALFVGDVGVMALAMAGVRRLKMRFLPDTEEDGGQAPRWVWRYLWFPVAQFALLFMVVGIAFDVLRWREGSAAVVAALFAFCAVVDVVLFVQIGRSVSRAQEEARAEVLEGRIVDYLRQVAAMQALLSQTAHLRHDLRNHRMVVKTLCERGEYGRASSYLEELAGQLRGGEEP